MTSNIKFISTVAGAIDTPPEPISKHVPDWYKNVQLQFAPPTPANLAKAAGTTYTIKGCTPVQDYLTSGYLIRFPEKVLLTNHVTNDSIPLRGVSAFTCSNSVDLVKFHHHYQCPIDIEGEKKMYIKFNPGWIIQTPPGYSCYFYQPEFFLEDRYKLFPAIVDTDKYTFDAVQFPGYLTKKEAEITIEPGTPMMAVFPFKRTDWESEIIEDLEFRSKAENASSIRKFNRFIYRKYLQYCHSAKKYK